MPPNILRYATAAHFGGNPVQQAITERRRAEEARAAAVVEAVPYTKTFEQYIADSYPRFPFTTHTRRLIAIGQEVADGRLPRLMVELPPRHWKSTIFSRFLPGYCLRRFPDRSGGICCQTQDLANGRQPRGLGASGRLALARAPASLAISCSLMTRSRAARRPRVQHSAGRSTTGGIPC
jgi:hypothetical protein